MPQFGFETVNAGIENPRFITFAPLWHVSTTKSKRKRLAIANEKEVRVYCVTENSFPGTLAPMLVLEFTLDMDPGHVITGLAFAEEASARSLVVAHGTGGQDHVPAQWHARIWNCDLVDGVEREAPNPEIPTAWSLRSGWVTTLSEHEAPIRHLAVTPSFLITADDVGECRVWQKSQKFSLKGAARLHRGRIAAIASDKNFIYSAGGEDLKISVWALPSLVLALTIVADVPVAVLPEGDAEAPVTVHGHCVLLTALQRPLSRWAGVKDAEGAFKAPRGSLYVAAVLAPDSAEGAKGGAPESGRGVLMEWRLGAGTPSCSSAVIVHDRPIVALGFGPYDNGPLITADDSGMCRVWDGARKFHLSQSEDFGEAKSYCGEAAHCLPASVSRGPCGVLPRMAIEPCVGVYLITGDRKLVVWRRSTPSPMTNPAF